VASIVELVGEVARHPALDVQVETQRPVQGQVLLDPQSDAYRAALCGQGMGSSASRTWSGRA
jgi:hypothetical protein